MAVLYFNVDKKLVFDPREQRNQLTYVINRSLSIYTPSSDAK